MRLVFPEEECANTTSTSLNQEFIMKLINNRLLRPAMQLSLLLSFALAIALAVAPASARSLHFSLRRAEPAVDTTVTKAPTELKLYFSEAVKVELTAVRLMGPDSALVALEPLTLGEGPIPPVVAKVKGTMKPGTHRVLWRAQGADGHVLNNEFKFTLKPAEPQIP